ncbi:uncharacterized protein LOC107369723 [Tetranychus urticae]|uniref:Uncharacterized protein n=1 Tax=Tetranychus urticae TaxID=32264 RepID=T1L2Y4_TETUR|nr:uncharacterized protein LOC107369723 [Tetranychus urticae]
MAVKACKQSSFLHIIYNKEKTDTLLKLAYKHLGLEENEAHVFLSSLFLTSTKTHSANFSTSLDKKLKLLTPHFTSSQIVNNPKLLTSYRLETLSQTIKDLQSFGVTKIGPEHLCNPKLLWQLSERDWKDYKLIDESVDCAASYIASISDTSGPTKQAIYDRLRREVPEYKSLPLKKLKPLITAYTIYLKQ